MATMESAAPRRAPAQPGLVQLGLGEQVGDAHVRPQTVHHLQVAQRRPAPEIGQDYRPRLDGVQQVLGVVAGIPVGAAIEDLTAAQLLIGREQGR